jgi:hypothetical protein
VLNYRLSRGKMCSLAAAVMAIIIGLAPGLKLHAQTPEEKAATEKLATAAGIIPLTSELIDGLDEAMKKVSADPTAKTEWDAAAHDASIKPEKWNDEIKSRCPKLAKVFKSAGLEPAALLNTVSTVAGALSLGYMAVDTSTLSKTAQANVAFVKAHENEVEAFRLAFVAFTKTGSSPSAAPSSSPRESPSDDDDN